jgi:hypothetical protein
MTPQDEVPPGKKRLWVGNGLSAVSIIVTTIMKELKRTVKRNNCSFKPMTIRTVEQDDCLIFVEFIDHRNRVLVQTGVDLGVD